jgi:hypothetical protein
MAGRTVSKVAKPSVSLKVSCRDSDGLDYSREAEEESELSSVLMHVNAKREALSNGDACGDRLNMLELRLAVSLKPRETLSGLKKIARDGRKNFGLCLINYGISVCSSASFTIQLIVY